MCIHNLRARTFLLVCASLLSGCSAAILSIGTDETSIIHYNSTRTSINQILGEPVEVATLNPPALIWELDEEDTRTQLLVESQSNSLILPDVVAVSQELYLYKARVQRQYDVGETIGLAGYTGFVSEAFMTPFAVYKQYQRGKVTHKITVWYDAAGLALAYRWVEVDEEGVPVPNLPEKIYKAPKMESIFNYPFEKVLSAAKTEACFAKFVWVRESQGRFNAQRSSDPGRKWDGEHLDVWVTSLGSNQAKVVIRTSLTLKDIEHQKSWNEEILQAIGRNLRGEKGESYICSNCEGISPPF